MSLIAALAALMLIQEPPAASADQPTRLEDIAVVGRSLRSMIDDFVGEVAAPNSGRGIARWDSAVCVGVANLQRETAEYIADRVSTVAEDIGLSPGAPGCKPNILVIATDQPSALASELVQRRSRAFRMGGSGMDRGGAALRAFQASDKPVRWWQQAMPVDSETGQRAVRIPGECRNSCTSVKDFAPTISVFSASRISSQIVDNIFRTIVVVDVNQTTNVSGQQLADYIAMISFAQIDPDADTRPYVSVLNVFDTPDIAEGLTDWDVAYLKGLYNAERTRQNGRAGKTEIAASIERTHERLRSASDGDEAPPP